LKIFGLINVAIFQDTLVNKKVQKSSIYVKKKDTFGNFIVSLMQP